MRGETFPVRMLRWVAVSPDGKRVAYQALGYVYVRDLPNGTPQAPHDADRPLRVLPVVVARRQVARLHDLERRHARLDPRRRRRDGRLPRRHGQARPLPRARLLARRLEDRLHEGDRRLPALDGLVRRSRPLPGPGRRRKVDARRRGRLRAALRQGLRPRLLRQDRGRRRPDRAGEAHPRLDQARRLGRRTSTTSPSSPRSSRSRPTGSGWRSARASTRTSRPSSRPDAASTSARRARPCPSRRSRRTPARTSASPATPSRLYWSFGPQLFERDLKDAFAFLPGAPEKLPDPPVVGRDIGFNAPVDEPAGAVAFTGGRVVTMKGDEVIEDGVVVVEGNRITAVGKRGAVADSGRSEDDRRHRARPSCPASSTPTTTAPSAPTASPRSRTGTATPRSPSASRPCTTPRTTPARSSPRPSSRAPA